MNYTNVDCIKNIQEPKRKIRASLVAPTYFGRYCAVHSNSNIEIITGYL